MTERNGLEEIYGRWEALNVSKRMNEAEIPADDKEEMCNQVIKVIEKASEEEDANAIDHRIEMLYKWKEDCSSSMSEDDALQLQMQIGLTAAIEAEEVTKTLVEEYREDMPAGIRKTQELSELLRKDYCLPIKSCLQARIKSLAVMQKQHLVTALHKHLKHISWPQVLDKDEMDERRETLAALSVMLENLLALQHASSAHNSESDSVWALEELFNPILRRFQFHFERPESKTNRLSKPEWVFTYINEQLGGHHRFLSHTVTPVLRNHVGLHLDCCDGPVILIVHFIQATQRKLQHELPTLLAHKELFCHTLDETLIFERSLDDEYDYYAWANEARYKYPRCIDMFTQEEQTLFTWTAVDVSYARAKLNADIFSQSTRPWDAYLDGLDELTAASPLRYVPRCAVAFVSTLDYLCRRFLPMAKPSHRYLYVSQVHQVLLQDFSQHCAQHLWSLDVGDAVESCPLNPSSFRQILLLLNAYQFVIDALHDWQESSAFLELAQMASESKQLRRRMLQIRLEYSKAVLQSASDAVLAREEAVAVRQAVAGPGSVIGPGRALAAAYSAGSTAMQSLFGRASDDTTGVEKTNAVVEDSVGSVVSEDNVQSSNPVEEEEAVLFSDSIFEHEVEALTKQLNASMGDVTRNVMRLVRRDVRKYRSAWFGSYKADRQEVCGEPSSELAPSLTLVSTVLVLSKEFLHEHCWNQLWKELAVQIDEELTGTVLDADEHVIAKEGGRQFETDAQSFVSVFSVCTSHPRAHLQKMMEVATLWTMDEDRVRDIRSVIANESGRDMDQVKTVLEASAVYKLRVDEVQTFWQKRL